MTRGMTTEEINNLKVGDLIYFWYPADGDLDLFDFEVVGVGHKEILTRFKLGLKFEFKSISFNDLHKYSSRAVIEDYFKNSMN